MKHSVTYYRGEFERKKRRRWPDGFHHQDTKTPDGFHHEVYPDSEVGGYEEHEGAEPQRFTTKFTRLRREVVGQALRLPCQIGTGSNRSQIVTASKRNVRFTPYVFTEHGAIMAATVLNSPRAVAI
jgi:hypothetical protein